MTKSNEFLNAVDIVCDACICRSEENCESCPVRKTCDQMDGPAKISQPNRLASTGMAK